MDLKFHEKHPSNDELLTRICQKDETKAVPETYSAKSNGASEIVAPLNSATRIPELDGLRGIAILMVLFLHYAMPLVESPDYEWLFSSFPGSLLNFGRLGWSGVDLFFVLSGFLIGGILLDAKAAPNYFKTFYIRRAYRILPIYWVLLGLFAVGAYLTTFNNFSALHWLFAGSIPWFAYATFTQNFWMAATGTWGTVFLGVSWSLAIEEQFYLTLPLAIRFLDKKRLVCLLVGAVCAAPVLRVLLLFGGSPRKLAPYVLMPCRADALVLGVLAAILLREKFVWDFLAKHRRVLTMTTFFFAFGIVYFVSKGWYRFTSPYMFAFGYTWIAIFYTCCLVIAVTLKENWFSRFLRLNPLMKIGQIAYGLYLIHESVLFLCYYFIAGTENRSVTGNSPFEVLQIKFAITLVALGLTFIIAQLSWNYFEKAFVRRGHYHQYDA
ncbi:MAG: acyltransferase [Actinomycetota bacterium]